VADLIAEYLELKFAEIRRDVQTMLDAHSTNPDAHPHAHDMEVSAAVEEHLQKAAEEIDAALSAEEPEPVTENEPLPAPEPPAPEPVREETEPKREHVLHRRLG
jgi:hypothetical protein